MAQASASRRSELRIEPSTWRIMVRWKLSSTAPVASNNTSPASKLFNPGLSCFGDWISFWNWIIGG